jgi:hypothetical protein
MSTFLPLSSVSHVFVGSLHARRVVRALEKLSLGQREKIVLLLTGETKKAGFDLVVTGGFKAVGLPPSLDADAPYDEKELSNEDLSWFNESESSPEPLFDFQPVQRRKVCLSLSLSFSSEAHSPPQPASALLGRSALPLPSSPNSPSSFAPFKVPKGRFPVRPCNDYYLSPIGCSRGDDCPYAHDTQFTAQEWDAFPSLIKSFICPKMRDEGYCGFGEECYMGHRCVSFLTASLQTRTDQSPFLVLPLLCLPTAVPTPPLPARTASAAITSRPDFLTRRRCEAGGTA